MEERVGTMKAPQPPSGAETNKNSLTSSKSEGLAAAIAAELMIGFWFGAGVVLAVKTLESLEYCFRRKC